MKPRDPAWKPVDYSEAVVLAFKSLATGTYMVEVTSEMGQKRLFRLVVE